MEEDRRSSADSAEHLGKEDVVVGGVVGDFLRARRERNQDVADMQEVCLSL